MSGFGGMPLLGGAQSGGGSYTGPLDIVPGAIVAYGQRALSSAMRGQPVLRLSDGPGGSVQTFSSDSTTGLLPISAIADFSANPIGDTWTDQSGNGLSLPKSTFPPSWSASFVNSNPGFGPFPGAEIFRLDSETTLITIPAALTILIVGKGAFLYAQGASPTPYTNLVTGVNGEFNFLDSYDGSANEAGGKYPTASDVHHVFIGRWTFGSSNLQIDGVTIGQISSFDSGGSTGSFDAISISIGTDGDPVNSGIAEAICWPTILSDANVLALYQDEKAFYGTP